MSKTAVFKDKVKLYVFAGHGGDGCSSFRREKFVPKGGPDGGDGGHGGHVFIQADKDTDSLLPLYFRPHQKAEHGVRGKGKKMHGKRGADLIVKVPCGTEVYAFDSEKFLGEVIEDGENLRIAKGGKGGLGNVHFMTSSYQAPREFTPGGKGEEKTLRLIMKLVANAALVGFPNAGKSTLLSRISHAHPKIASYPFTTLNPIIGTVKFEEDYSSIRVADIPGLIEGAHTGIGLGHEFLRHIERTQLLIFVIDLAGTDGRDPADDYIKLREELQAYRPDLNQRPFVVVANKMDALESEDQYDDFVQKTGTTPFKMSAQHGEGLVEFEEELLKLYRSGIFQ